MVVDRRYAVRGRMLFLSAKAGRGGLATDSLIRIVDMVWQRQH